MSIAANFVLAIAGVVNILLTIFFWIIVARAVLSWVNPDPYNPIVRFIYNVTEPVLGWVRRKVPLNFGPVDFSSVIVFLAIYFLQKFLVASLQDIALSLR